jgi:hypothetical protein
MYMYIYIPISCRLDTGFIVSLAFVNCWAADELLATLANISHFF